MVPALMGVIAYIEFSLDVLIPLSTFVVELFIRSRYYVLGAGGSRVVRSDSHTSVHVPVYVNERQQTGLSVSARSNTAHTCVVHGR